MVKTRDAPQDRSSYLKKKKEKKVELDCPYGCGGKLRPRGSGDAAGGYFFKCKNKKCGRTVWKRKDPPKEVIPVVYEKKV